MKKPISDTEALARLQHLCSKSEKCRQDVRDKLKQWAYQGDFETIVDRLSDEKFVDDTRFSESYVRDKIRFSAWGKNKIRYHLRGKRISDETIEMALNSISEDDYRSIVQKELEKKTKSIKEQDPIKTKQKLLAFAAQRGYEADLIYNLVDSILNKD